jgi:hypothetical protein
MYGQVSVPAHPDSACIATGRCELQATAKIQPAKLHPQIGYRRFTPARGGQVPWVRRRPRRHTARPRPRGTGTLGAPTASSAHGSASPAETSARAGAIWVPMSFSSPSPRSKLTHRKRAKAKNRDLALECASVPAAIGSPSPRIL